MATALIIAVILAALIGFIYLYNSVIAMRQLTNNAWSDFDVYLERRS